MSVTTKVGDPPPRLARMTFLGAVLGGLLLPTLHRWSGHARRSFVRATAALTALSCVPSITMPDGTGSQVAPEALHVVAAAIVVPAPARHARS
jgi:hypothetical protein